MGNANYVFGLFGTPDQAEAAVDELVDVGFEAWTIAVLFHDNLDSRDFARKMGTRPPHGTDHGKAASEPLDGNWGFMNPATGPSEGALPGALADMGIPADWYDGKTLEGKVLLSVGCAFAESVLKATEILLATGAEETGSSTVSALSATG